MRKYLKIIITSLSLLTSPVYADKDTDQIAKDTAKYTAEDYVKKETAKQLDKIIPYEVTIGEVSGGAASSALAVYGMIKSVDDFFKAETDKGRGFAAANTYASYLMFVNPAAGLVVGLALMAIQIFDGLMSAKHARVMADLQEKIAEYMKEVADMAVIQIRMELIKVESLTKRLDDYSKGMKRSMKYMTEHCTVAEKLTSIEQINFCVLSVADYYALVGLYVRTSDKLINSYYDHIDLDLLLDNKDFDKEKLNKTIEELKPKIKESEEKISSALKMFSKASTQIILDNISNKKLLTRAQEYAQYCYDNYYQKALDLDLNSSKYLSSQTPEEDFEKILNLAGIFSNSGCEEAIKELPVIPAERSAQVIVQFKQSFERAQSFLN